MDSIWKDITFAARALRNSPAFALTAILTLALGIGVSTAIFSVVNAVLLRPLPYADPERLVLVWGDMRNRKVQDFPFPTGDFSDLRQEGTLFESLAAVTTFRVPFGGDGVEPEQVKAAQVTTNFFSLLGARMMLGRDFVEADGTPQPRPPQPAPGTPAPAPGAAAPRPPRLPGMVILSNEFWQRRYGSDRTILGRSIEFGNQSLQVIGVLAPGFEVLYPPGTNIERSNDLYFAARIDFGNDSPGSRINVFLRVLGRLKPNVTLQQAQTQADRIASELRERFPIKKTAGLYFRVEPMHADVVADVRPGILALMGAVGFVLLIACANVANLLLVRASGRERELAVRAALGGSQWRLVKQMLIESALLAAVGAGLGLALAEAGIKLLGVVAPPSLPRMNEVSIDGWVLGFTTVAGVLSALLFGLVPAIRASRPDLMDVLRATGRTTGQRAGALMRSGVVMLEVALSFILLIGCGLMIRSFVALHRTDPGYDPRNILTFYATNPRIRSSDEAAAFIRTMQDRLKALPGVVSVTAATPFPLDGLIRNARWGPPEALSDASKFQQANVHAVLPGYFEAMKTRLIAGRTFAEQDNDTSAKVVILDDKLAARAFPGENPVGKQFLVRINTPEAHFYTVVGVVAHQRHEGLASDGREALFITDGFDGHGSVARWAIRTRGDPAFLAPLVRAEMRRFDANIPLAEVRPFQELVDAALAPTRFALVLIGIFAAIAVVLAVVGLYGVLSTVVRQRTPEIGVRMAFGAPSRSIFALLIGQGVRLSAGGILAGAIAALMLTRVMTTMLVGVKPNDPSTYAAIALLFLVIAMAASWLPARRAAALDPTVALREE
jgi:predicted permease